MDTKKFYGLRKLVGRLKIFDFIRQLSTSIEVRDRKNTESIGVRFDEWIIRCPIKSFIDIGAHTGEFIDHWSQYFPGLKVWAFEPLPDFASNLKEKYKTEKNIKIYPIALGDRKGTEIIHISAYPPSSSLLKMADAHKIAFPHTAGSMDVEIAIDSLDDVLAGANLPSELMIKIDTQGYEDRVIRGGPRILQMAKYLLIEVSFVSLYEGQVLFDEINNMLMNLGFQFAGMRNQILSPIDRKPLQGHAWFIRI